MGGEIYVWTAKAPKISLNARERVPFRARLAAPPAGVRDVLVKFDAPGDKGGQFTEFSFMSGERQVKVLYDERTIAQRTEELAREIAATKLKDLLVVAILKGSFMFAADLLRALHRVGLEPQVEFFHLSSYVTGTVSSGTVKILRDIEFFGPRSRRSAR